MKTNPVISEPFVSLRKVFENEIEIAIQKFNPLQVRYALWLLSVWKEQKAAFTYLRCLSEDVLWWLWFPISILTRKDPPLIFRPMRRKTNSIDQRSENGKLEWRKKLSEDACRDVEKVHDFWTEIINQHQCHWDLGHGKRMPVLTPLEVESHYRSLLKKASG